MEIHGLLVDGDGRQLDQPVWGYFWSVLFVLQCEGQAFFWGGIRNRACVKQLVATGVSVCLLTFSGRHLHFFWNESTAVSQLPVVADGPGEEDEGAGPGLHAVVGQHSKHLKVPADNHAVGQFDLWKKQTPESDIAFKAFAACDSCRRSGPIDRITS